MVSPVRSARPAAQRSPTRLRRPTAAALVRRAGGAATTAPGRPASTGTPRRRPGAPRRRPGTRPGSRSRPTALATAQTRQPRPIPTTAANAGRPPARRRGPQHQQGVQTRRDRRGRPRRARTRAASSVYSTVTDLARLRGWSTSWPRAVAISHASTCSGTVVTSGASSVGVGRHLDEVVGVRPYRLVAHLGDHDGAGASGPYLLDVRDDLVVQQVRGRPARAPRRPPACPRR